MLIDVVVDDLFYAVERVYRRVVAGGAFEIEGEDISGHHRAVAQLRLLDVILRRGIVYLLRHHRVDAVHVDKADVQTAFAQLQDHVKGAYPHVFADDGGTHFFAVFVLRYIHARKLRIGNDGIVYGLHLVFAQIGDGDVEVALNGIGVFQHAFSYHGVGVVFEIRGDVAVLFHKQKPDERKHQKGGDNAHHNPFAVEQFAGERRRERAFFALFPFFAAEFSALAPRARCSAVRRRQRLFRAALFNSDLVLFLVHFVPIKHAHNACENQFVYNIS